MGKRPARIAEQALQEQRRVAERHLTGSGRIRQLPLTPQRKAVFLDELRKHGVIAEASRIASPGSVGTPSATFYSERERDPHFAAEWDTAVEQANGRLELEAIRRAVDGVPRGIFQKGGRVFDHDGKPASETEYSDRLLEVLLRGRIPKRFGDHRHVQIEGAVRHVHEDANDGLFIGVSDLSLLSDAQRRDLYGILETLTRARGESPDVLDAEFEEMVDSDPAALPSPDPADTPLASLADADLESLSPDEAAALEAIL